MASAVAAPGIFRVITPAARGDKPLSRRPIPIPASYIQIASPCTSLCSVQHNIDIPLLVVVFPYLSATWAKRACEARHSRVFNQGLTNISSDWLTYSDLYSAMRGGVVSVSTQCCALVYLPTEELPWMTRSTSPSRGSPDFEIDVHFHTKTANPMVGRRAHPASLAVMCISSITLSSYGFRKRPLHWASAVSYV